MPDDLKPEPQNVSAQPARARVGPIGYQLLAREFLEAGMLVAAGKRPRTWALPFLYCRAIELALKAFLLARGRDVAHIRRLGHDLNLLLTEACTHGLDQATALTSEHKDAIVRWNEQYLAKDLEYFELFSLLTGPPPTSDTVILAAAATQKVNDVERGCLVATSGPYRPF